MTRVWIFLTKRVGIEDQDIAISILIKISKLAVTYYTSLDRIVSADYKQMQQNLRSFTSREAYIPRLTSRDISERAKLEKLELETRMWRCPCCQKVNDRDANAAINIKNVGASTFSLGDVSPSVRVAIAV